MKMKVLGISGSPNNNGNTAQAIQYALSLFDPDQFATEYVSLAGLTLEYCQACFECDTGPCIHDDDIESILKSMQNCDVLLLGSPVYMGLISAQLKTLMDRSVQLRVGGAFKMAGKIGAGITCGNFRNGGQELTLQCLHTYFLQQNMAAIADGAPWAHSGGTIVGDFKKDKLGQKTIENLVNNIIFFVSKSE